MLRDLFSLFPAYAGVIPEKKSSRHHCNTFPRIRGGDPSTHDHRTREMHFSPHMRGGSLGHVVV